jgi:seryl-tRNA synthetase
VLDPKFVTEHLEDVRAALARRGTSAAEELAAIASIARSRRERITELEALRARKNQASAAMAKANKESEEFARVREEMKRVGERTKELEQRLAELEAALEERLLALPNLPHESTPDGASSEDNAVVRVWGDKPRYEFAPRDHVAIGEATGILDFERGSKLSGARFTVLRGAGARLERALMAFMLDLHSGEHGYEEVWPPVLVKDSAARGTGQLPKFARDMFRIERFEEGEGARTLYLAPTAEVPVTNLHADEILDGAALPIAYTAYTPCFRSEAGSYGKDTRGLIRQHQFDKVELVRFVAPETALDELEKLTRHAEAVLERLGLHYRTVALCAGDLGFASRKTYDIEVWLPGQNAYREVSSCSWFGDFQARRAKIRFRREPGAKPELVHTLNGSGLAIGRTLVAILEQYQQADGSVRIPEALVPYCGGLRVIPTRASR